MQASNQSFNLPSNANCDLKKVLLSSCSSSTWLSLSMVVIPPDTFQCRRGYRSMPSNHGSDCDTMETCQDSVVSGHGDHLARHQARLGVEARAAHLTLTFVVFRYQSFSLVSYRVRFVKELCRKEFGCKGGSAAGVGSFWPMECAGGSSVGSWWRREFRFCYQNHFRRLFYSSVITIAGSVARIDSIGFIITA